MSERERERERDGDAIYTSVYRLSERGQAMRAFVISLPDLHSFERFRDTTRTAKEREREKGVTVAKSERKRERGKETKRQ